MRMLIVSDREGRILATSRHPDDAERSDPSAPRPGGFLPLDGQIVHTVEVETALVEHPVLAKLHETHRVIVDGEHARLAPIARR